jgi:hypothetical protein
MTSIDARLIACTSDIAYELKMIGVLGQLKTPVDLPFVGNGLLESLLVHIRLLDDFLANKRRRGPQGDDDLTASDYNPVWLGNGFLKDDERSSINKKVAHLTRSRQDKDVDRQWRSSGSLDAEGNWHRGNLSERALATFTKFWYTLDPNTAKLFGPALTEAWNLYLSSLEVHGRVESPVFTAERIIVLGNRVTVWRGTSPLVFHEVMDGDPPRA